MRGFDWSWLAVVIQPSLPMFLLGLAIGTALLLIGLGLGLWAGRRMTPPPILEGGIEREQVLRFVRNFANWTSEFAGDISRYQTQVRSLSQEVLDRSGQMSADDIQRWLGRISEANEKLQARVEQAEAKLESQTKELASYLTEARTDGLTALANRRAFDQRIDERFARWTNCQTRFCLALIDIDFFKKINDVHGHPAGDRVLQEVAIQLRAFAGEGTEVARYGGEEFAILIDDSLEAAAKAVDQLRASIAAKAIVVEGKSIPVTISAGVSLILADERVGNLVRRADEALYAAKAAGRNRVYLHDGKSCLPHAEACSPIGRNEISSPATGNENPEAVLDPLQRRLQERFERLLNDQR
jgi:diguanylate cyclase